MQSAVIATAIPSVCLSRSDIVPGRMKIMLEKLKLNTLEEKRNRADVIILLKMYKGLTQPPFESMFQLTRLGQTRGHTLKISKHCTKRDIRLHFFSKRVINICNSLDQTVVDSESEEVFKRRLHFIYEEQDGRWTYWRIDIFKVLGRIKGYSPGPAVPGK